ncbi:MAG: TIR domain-containing protein [Deltaproteobacteria bacterium]|nr:TIR domain-containing protein [Deltaproteobacteria bacterium]
MNNNRNDVLESKERKYKAFISYSHRDTKWGEWLRKALEKYRVPNSLVGITNDDGVVIEKRLGALFRDRDELAASSDLSESIRNALRCSENMIVVCSPFSAKSTYVNEEIKEFKRLGRSDKIHALIVEGVPHASNSLETEDLECFPDAFRFELNEQGKITNKLANEPIAADARKCGDGKRNAKLKLTASILGIGFDLLKQREKSRRQLLLTLWCAGIVMILVTMIYLGLKAYISTIKAKAERAEAQRENSRSLTELSNVQAMKGDAVTGAWLAMAALPKSYDPRPYVPEAFVALHRAFWLQREAVVIGNKEKSVREAMFFDSSHVITFDNDGSLLFSASYDSGEDHWSSNNVSYMPDSERTIPSSGYEPKAHRVAISPNRKYIATSGLHGVAFILDSKTGNVITKLKGHQSMVTSIQFVDNGTKVLTSSQDGSAILWKVATGHIIHKIEVEEGKINHAVANPSGELIAIALRSGAVMLVDSVTGKLFSSQFPKPQYHNSYAAFLRFDSSGRWLLSSGWDEKLRVWNMSTLKLKYEPINVGLRVRDAKFSPNGKLIVAGISDGYNKGRAEGYAGIWDTTSGKLITILKGHSDDVLSVDFSPDGENVVTASVDKTAIVWKCRDGSKLTTLRGHKNILTAVIYSDDGHWILTKSRDGTARIWSALHGLPVTNFISRKHALISYNKDLSLVLIENEEGSHEVLNLTNNSIVQLQGSASNSVTAALFNRNLRSVLTYSEVESAQLWSTENGKMLRSFPKRVDGILSAQFSPNGSVLATSYSDGTVCFWDTTKDSEPNCVQASPDAIKSVIFDNEGYRLLAISTGITATIIELNNKMSIKNLGQLPNGRNPLGHSATINSGVFSKDGSLVITGAIDGFVIVWDTLTGEIIAKLNANRGRINSINQVAFGRDDSLIAAATEDGCAFIWNRHTLKIHKVLQPHGDNVWRIDFNLAGDLIATASWDGGLRIWRVDDGMLIAEYLAPSRRVFDVSLSGDGNRVMLQYGNGETLLLPVFDKHELLVEHMCEKLPRPLTQKEKVSFKVDGMR